MSFRLWLSTALLLGLPSASFADELPRLGSVKLAMVVTPNVLEIVTVPAIQTRACAPTETEASMTVRCDVAGGSSFSIRAADGRETTFMVKRMVYFYTPANGDYDARSEFYYVGDFRKVVDGLTVDAPFALSIQYDQGTPEALRGYFRMSDLGLTYQVRGERTGR